MHICINKLGHDQLGLWLGACSAPSHRCWPIINRTLMNIFQWNLHQNTTIFISSKCIWKCCLTNVNHFVSASLCLIKTASLCIISAFIGISREPQFINLNVLINVYLVGGRTSSQAFCDLIYRKVSNIRRTKSQNLNDSRLVLHLSLPNRLKPGVKSRMKM